MCRRCFSFIKDFPGRGTTSNGAEGLWNPWASTLTSLTISAPVCFQAPCGPYGMTDRIEEMGLQVLTKLTYLKIRGPKLVCVLYRRGVEEGRRRGEEKRRRGAEEENRCREEKKWRTEKERERARERKEGCLPPSFLLPPSSCLLLPLPPSPSPFPRPLIPLSRDTNTGSIYPFFLLSSSFPPPFFPLLAAAPSVIRGCTS